MRKMLASVLGFEPFMKLGDALFPGRIPIFMMHRFRHSETDPEGHDPALLKFALEYMRMRKFNFVSVEEIARSMLTGRRLPPRSVAFSIDDGFWDHAEVPAELFGQYNCPTTYFVTTGFIEGDLWLWDSKVDFLVRTATPEAIDRLVNTFSSLSLNGKARSEISHLLVFELARYDSARIAELLEQIRQAVELDLPASPPDDYKPISWARLRTLERMGMRIAPHSYSHPILNKEPEEITKYEISKSWKDLCEKLSSPSPVFCYPVGRTVDYGKREESLVEEMGFVGAVSALPGAVDLTKVGTRFCMPRFAFPDNKADIVQYATWIESFKDSLRS